MTDKPTLLELAERCARANPNDRSGLNHDVARAAGWQRITPSQMGRGKHGGWIAPDDYLGRYSNGSPILDGLHGTDILREPLNFLASLDAAMQLVPEGWRVQRLGEQQESDERGPYLEYWSARLHWPLGGMLSNLKWGKGATPALAITAAALRALAEQGGE